MRERNAVSSTNAAQGASCEEDENDEEAWPCGSPRRQRCGDRLRDIPEPVRLRSVGYNNGYYNNGYNNGYYNNDGQAGRVAARRRGRRRWRRASPAPLSRASASGSGAIAGAILGGVLGATINGRQYYRDTRGYCYYVDQYGQPHYNYNTRC